MREWLSGGASPCQGEGRGFDPRLALQVTQKGYPIGYPFCIIEAHPRLEVRFVMFHSGRRRY